MDTYTLAPTPPPPPPPPDPTQGPPPTFLKKYQKYLIIGGVVFGFLLMFLLGMALSRSSKPVTQPVAEVEPTETPIPTMEPTAGVPSPVQTSFQYLPGKQYTDDSVAIVTKTEPYQVVYTSISRMQQARNYLQLSKVDYYNGTDWKRETVSSSVEKPELVLNPLVTQWNIKALNSNSQNTKNIAVTIQAESLSFTLKKLSYEISARSLPGYTKINYFGEGILTTSSYDEPQAAYIFITQTNSSNASDLAYLGNAGQIEDQWLVFWDTEGNAYHYDKLSSANSKSVFENYQTAFLFSPAATLTKLTPSGIQRINGKDQYFLKIITNPETRINYVIGAPLNKSIDKKLLWQTGYITGNVETKEKTIDGVGLIETIEKVK